jgi:hypothetical protein
MQTVLLVIVTAVIALFGTDLGAGEEWQGTAFSADFSETFGNSGQEAQRGRMYLDEPGMRMETTEEGEPVVMIIRFAENDMLSLVPGEKIYMKIPYAFVVDGQNARLEQKFAGPCAEFAQREKLGSDTVAGRATEKWRCAGSYEDEADATEWYDPELGIPLRAEDEDGGRFELSNIQVGSQPANLFQPPADYQVMDMGAMMQMQMGD